jgi:F-type H+-transporting ATPase subunit b
MLEISPILLISSGIVFLIVLARLNSCLYRPLFKHMDDRSSSIAKDLANAKNNSANVESMVTQAKEIISKAKQEASSIRKIATQEAKEIAETTLATAKLKLDTKYKSFTQSLEEDRDSLRDSLEANMPVFKKSLQQKVSSI